MHGLRNLRNTAINNRVTTPAEPDLTSYPRPSVAVDTAVLTVWEGQLSVLLVRRREQHHPGEWALPGTFLHERETLERAVMRSLRKKVGIAGRVPRQLHVFDDPGRDDRGWVLSVAHVDAVPASALAGPLASDDVRLASVAGDADLIAGLPFGHAEMVAAAVDRLRGEYAQVPDPGGLLEEPFTLRDLRDVHEAVAGKTLMRDTFRRFMEPQLTGTGRMSDGTRGRPSRLWVRGRPRG